ncbi:hypothetical protein CIT31_30095 [Mesorhizobium wenxiniae]|uniref:Uncharacterized protein n=1 Tax=Mesorhizobium wenxiniae TaxID=2014805 RepID=A0A271K7A7_9HYPH|nr:hypothetical protein CIT31_30095 [Mesorhizobium wenxiniae]
MADGCRSRVDPEDQREVNQPTQNVFRDHLMLEYEIPNRKRDQLVAVLTQIDEEAYSTKKANGSSRRGSGC